MQLEAPKDQYQQVLRGFEKKISQGKIPGVSDPKDAEKIVRKGKPTYDQAVNLTKPRTVESVAYDAATGAVTCSCAFGLSFLATTFMAYRETRDITGAVQAGIAAGVQVFGLSFAQHMVVSQLSRAGLSNALMAPSQAVVGKLGFKASATIVNGLRALTGKTAISGAAASKQLAKMLRGNAVSAAVTLAVFSVPETYKLFQGKASGAQYAQNMACLATSIAGGNRRRCCGRCRGGEGRRRRRHGGVARRGDRRRPRGRHGRRNVRHGGGGRSRRDTVRGRQRVFWAVLQCHGVVHGGRVPARRA